MPVLSNAQWEQFATLVAKGDKPPKAYVAAGYSKAGAAQSARRLLKNVEICFRITELMSNVEQPSTLRAIEKAALSKAWVLTRLMDLADRCLGTGKNFHPAGANRALELLGKEQGMFVDRKLHLLKRLEDMSEDELAAVLGEDADPSGAGSLESAEPAGRA